MQFSPSKVLQLTGALTNSVLTFLSSVTPSRLLIFSKKLPEISQDFAEFALSKTLTKIKPKQVPLPPGLLNPKQDHTSSELQLNAP
jgi:hypothetical protein